MGININSKILLSVASIAAATALIVGATVAFFSDTETSTGNTFTAGSLDLQVDSQAHYDGLVCTPPNIPGGYTWQLPAPGGSTTRPELIGQPCEGTWSQADIGTRKFFSLTDIKPGDSGEDTVSLHVIDNDAWGRFVISQVTPTPDNDLRNALLFNVWIDQGNVDGFQCGATPKCSGDPEEGDNVQGANEQTLISQGTLDLSGESHNIYDGLIAAYTLNGCTGDGGNITPLTCPGLAPDGRMIGSTTYYFGIAWELPGITGNQVQGDSLSATMEFQVVQARNNPAKEGFPTI